MRNRLRRRGVTGRCHAVRRRGDRCEVGLSVALVALGAISGCTSFGTGATDAPNATTDAGSAVPTEAGVLTDGADPRAASCAGGAFCDSFEREAGAVQGNWTDYSRGVAERVGTIDGAHPRTGTGAFHVTIDSDGVNNLVGPALYLNWPTTEKTHATFTFWFFTADASRQSNIAELNVDGRPGTASGLIVGLGQGRLILGRQPEQAPPDGGNGYEDMNDSDEPAVLEGEWNEVVIDFDLRTSTSGRRGCVQWQPDQARPRRGPRRHPRLGPAHRLLRDQLRAIRARARRVVRRRLARDHALIAGAGIGPIMLSISLA